MSLGTDHCYRRDRVLCVERSYRFMNTDVNADVHDVPKIWFSF